MSVQVVTGANNATTFIAGRGKSYSYSQIQDKVQNEIQTYLDNGVTVQNITNLNQLISNFFNTTEGASIVNNIITDVAAQLEGTSLDHYTFLNPLSVDSETNVVSFDDSAYYPVTGGIINGWAQVGSASGQNLYVTNNIQFSSEVNKNSPTLIISENRLAKDFATGTGSYIDYSNAGQLTLAAGDSTIVMNNNGSTKINQSLNLVAHASHNQNSYGPHIIMDRKSGIWSYDARGLQYGQLYQNARNLWMGASESDDYHHYGGAYISTGWHFVGDDGTDSPTIDAAWWQGYETIRIGIPDLDLTKPMQKTVQGNGYGPNTATTYPVLHTGNLDKWLARSEFVQKLAKKLGITQSDIDAWAEDYDFTIDPNRTINPVS